MVITSNALLKAYDNMKKQSKQETVNVLDCLPESRDKDTDGLKDRQTDK